MIISSRKELLFVIKADRMMNRGSFKRRPVEWLVDLIIPDIIMKYLRTMRKVSFYKTKSGGGGKLYYLLYVYYLRKYMNLSLKLGFSIGYNCFGYGLVIPHYGTIIVGGSNRIGNYSVLHTSTCITDNQKIIGDGLYLSTGSLITSCDHLGNNITIGANTLVDKSFNDDNVLLVGSPAICLRSSDAWYERDFREDRVCKIEKLRKQLFENG